jgi:hypothetical protein
MNDLQINTKAQELVTQLMVEAGISDKKPFEVLARLLSARKMTLDKYGEEHYEEDNMAQGKAVELTLRLKRLLDNKVNEVAEATVTHKMSAEDISRLESIAAELKGLEKRLKSDKVQQGIIDVTVASSTHKA